MGIVVSGPDIGGEPHHKGNHKQAHAGALGAVHRDTRAG